MNDNFTITKDMALTYAGFFRHIDAALHSHEFEKKPNGIILEGEGGKRLEITLGPQGERRIAHMVIERVDVTMEFTGYTEAEKNEALLFFDHAFQRGGG